MGEGGHVMDWLQEWYAARCDGDWEHEWGVEIGTLDNPGWSVRIDLGGTGLEGRDFPRRDLRRSEDDWVVAWTSEGAFRAACGPRNLTEVLVLFRGWAEESTSVEG
ncbi:immunity 53 family protein [Actinacidiphila bryophytorum]|uniref:immunity 53 family protein n=1 Tax=Actinacidiphila bryophytorum TaxID=1436133 RepID=UPI002176AA49|nr:immunity 53 family protein [Actinacidiphila bryophytorum]UWE13062.1 immunity 53 family protein [Actinacidiphila bryophytorum]